MGHKLKALKKMNTNFIRLCLRHKSKVGFPERGKTREEHHYVTILNLSVITGANQEINYTIPAYSLCRGAKFLVVK